MNPDYVSYPLSPSDLLRDSLLAPLITFVLPNPYIG